MSGSATRGGHKKLKTGFLVFSTPMEPTLGVGYKFVDLVVCWQVWL